MSAKLFVGGLSWSTDDNSLKVAFEQHGEVVDAKVVLDRDTGKSRGFGFVTFANSSDAEAAKNSLNQTELDGREIRVDTASDRAALYGHGHKPA
jgi:RNA recognition motif-containing protein